MDISKKISDFFDRIKIKYETMMDEYKSNVNAVYEEREGHGVDEDFDIFKDDGGEN